MRYVEEGVEGREISAREDLDSLTASIEATERFLQTYVLLVCEIALIEQITSTRGIFRH